MYKKILVATDGSEFARKAIAAGIELASLGNGTVVDVHVRQPVSVIAFGESSLMVPPEIAGQLTKQVKEESRRMLTEIEDAARKSGVGARSLTSRAIRLPQPFSAWPRNARAT